MNLQENISRIKEMMGLNEVSNPYSITWLEPTREYFNQELEELLGNEMRFSKNEFFHPQNYDLMYSIFPHTFKMIAEHSKGSDVENEEEIKDILLDKEISDLMDDWDNFRQVLLKDGQSQMEGFNLFNKGTMEEWDDDKINNTFYMGRFSKEFPGMFKDTTSSGLIKQMTGDDEVKKHNKGYVDNIEKLRTERHRELPAPFVMKLPSGGREGNEHTLIGGHKRSTIANQLNVPISVWFIDLSYMNLQENIRRILMEESGLSPRLLRRVPMEKLEDSFGHALKQATIKYYRYLPTINDDYKLHFFAKEVVELLLDSISHLMYPTIKGSWYDEEFSNVKKHFKDRITEWWETLH